MSDLENKVEKVADDSLKEVAMGKSAREGLPQPVMITGQYSIW